MERPSHGNFQISHSFSHRLASTGLAATLPFAVLWALTHGMMGHIIRDAGPLHFIPDRKLVIPAPPPSKPVLENITQQKAVPPVIYIEPDQKDDRGALLVAPLIPKTDGTATVAPDRVAAGVASTHTLPPYPVMALRMGAEGKVVLQLTVLADGKVAKAEIVTSSGRADLDAAAQAWIVAHWLYKPALEKGQPVATQAQATVIFSLNNQR